MPSFLMRRATFRRLNCSPPSKQFLVNAGTDVDLHGVQPDLFIPSQKALVLFGSIGGFAADQAIIAVSAYPECFGHFHYGKYVLVFGHKLIGYPLWVMKMSNAFFKISRFIRTSASCFFNSANSLSSGVWLGMRLPGKGCWGCF